MNVINRLGSSQDKSGNGPLVNEVKVTVQMRHNLRERSWSQSVSAGLF